MNAHATSTLAGDLAEFNAIKKVFGKNTSEMKINGTKERHPNVIHIFTLKRICFYLKIVVYMNTNFLHLKTEVP